MLTETGYLVRKLTGTDAAKVSFTDSGANTALTVDTSAVSAAGGTVVFDITVTEAGCTSITYNVTGTVANPYSRSHQAQGTNTHAPRRILRGASFIHVYQIAR